jgi:hypothetical protein
MLGTLKKKVRNLSPQKSSPQTFSAGSRDHVTPEEGEWHGCRHNHTDEEMEGVWEGPLFPHPQLRVRDHRGDLKAGSDPAIASYDASGVKVYDILSSLVFSENKNTSSSSLKNAQCSLLCTTPVLNYKYLLQEIMLKKSYEIVLEFVNYSSIYSDA